MKLVMDSDCLIKLTKAGLKETLCDAWDVHVPTLVRRETTVPAPALPDAVRIRENIAAGRIVVVATGTTRGKGEDAVLKLYRSVPGEIIDRGGLHNLQVAQGLNR